MSSLDIWAPWPRHGFDVPHFFGSAIAFGDIDDAVRLVRELNADAGTNNRTGWRAVKVELSKVQP
jgi:hypothetical protein